MDCESRIIVHLDVADSRDVQRNSPKMEKILVERGLEKVVYQLPIVIWEVLSDASRTIIALLSKIFIFHPSNMQECWDYQIKDLHWF